MRSLETPVLIVGAGPAGLMASLLLQRMGIETLLIERRRGPQRAPAAHVINARTLEICRAAGVDMQALTKAAQAPADAGRVYWVTKLGGRVLGGLPFERQGDDQLALTPTPLRNLSQSRFEPLLLAALGGQGHGPRWQCEWESAELEVDGVCSRLRDLQRDEPFEVRSRYLLAADGAGSRIRKAFGIGVEGPDRIQSFVMIHFRAALRDRVGTPPGVLLFVCDPESQGVFVIHDLDAEAVYMLPFDPEREPFESYDEARCAERVRRALADPTLDFQIETIGSWVMTAQVAERYRRGPVFLVGDAAHRFPPTGGLGLNTGVQDVHNLAWKLAWVLKGRAREALLDSYEIERRPVAQNNAAQSLRNALRLVQVPQALGIADASAAARARMQGTLADPEGRQRVAAAIADQVEHFDMPGLQLGFAYREGALMPEAETGTASDPRHFRPSGAPGHRLPHAWLSTGESLLDAVPLEDVLLLVGPQGRRWLDAAARLDVQGLLTCQLSSELLPDLGAWLEAAGIEGEGALLVRPDQHVAWRARGGSADPGGALVRALHAVLEPAAHG